MTMMQETIQNAGNGVGVAEGPEHLDILKQPGCAGVVLNRPTDPALQAWIDGLDPALLPSARLILKPQKVETALTEVWDASGISDGPHRRRLFEDIADLAHILSTMMSAPYVRVRLERVTSNACRRFHVDAATARLVCTYRGTGTQYGTSDDGAEPGQIFTVPTGDPILLRGTLWPETPYAGLQHRSPPIEGSGETRLVLVIDPIFDPEDAV